MEDFKMPPVTHKRYTDKELEEELASSYDIIRIEKDCNCFYSSLSYEVYGKVSLQGQVRQEIANEIQSNWTVYEGFSAEKRSHATLRDIIREVTTDRTFGSDFYALAAANLYNRRIFIHVPYYPYKHTYGDGSANPPIHLIFQNNNHYNVMRKTAPRSGSQTAARESQVNDDNDSLRPSTGKKLRRDIEAFGGQEEAAVEQSCGNRGRPMDQEKSCSVAESESRSEAQEKNSFDKRVQKDDLGAVNNTKRSILDTSKGPYQCTLCVKTFKYKCRLKSHLETHADTKKYKCGECDKSFRTKNSLKYHLKIHGRNDADKKFKCPSCGKAFYVRDQLQKHLIVHREKKDYECLQCGHTYKTKSNLTKHLATHEVDRKYVCPTCKKPFRTKGVLQGHMKLHERAEADKKHECPSCKKKCWTRSDLQKHLIIHKPTYDFECTQCGKMFRRRMELNHHMRVHDATLKPVIICDFCKKVFQKESTHYYHVKHRVCQKLRLRFPCFQCSAVYCSSKSLHTHVRFHDPTRKFQCKVCKLRFTTSGGCKLHLRTHMVMECNDKGGSQQKLLFKARGKLAKHAATQTKPTDVITDMLIYCRLSVCNKTFRRNQPKQEENGMERTLVCCYCLRKKIKTYASTLPVIRRHLNTCHLEEHKVLISSNEIEKGKPMPNNEFHRLYNVVYLEEITRERHMAEAGYSKKTLSNMLRNQKKRKLQDLEGPFQCKMCDKKQYINYNDFVRHVSTSHGNKPSKSTPKHDKAQHTHLVQEDRIGSSLLNEMYGSLQLLKMSEESNCQPEDFQPTLPCLYCKQHSNGAVHFTTIPSLKTHLYLQHQDMYVGEDVITHITTSDETRGLVAQLLQHSSEIRGLIQKAKENEKYYRKSRESLKCPHCTVLHRMKNELYYNYGRFCSHLVEHHGNLVTPKNIVALVYPKGLKIEPAILSIEERTSVNARINYKRDYEALMEFLVDFHKGKDKHFADGVRNHECVLCHSAVFENFNELYKHLQRYHLPSRYRSVNRRIMNLLDDESLHRRNPVLEAMENHIKAYDPNPNTNCQSLIKELQKTTPYRLKKLEENRHIYILLLVKGRQRYPQADVKDMLLNGSNGVDLVIYVGKCSSGPVSLYHFSPFSGDWPVSTVQKYLQMGYQAFYVAGWKIEPTDTCTSKSLMEEWEAKLQWMLWFAAMFTSTYYRFDQKIEYEVLKRHNEDKQLIKNLSSMVLRRSGNMFCAADAYCVTGCTDFPLGHLKFFEEFTQLNDNQHDFQTSENMVLINSKTLSWCARNAKTACDLANLKISPDNHLEVVQMNKLVNCVIMEKSLNAKHNLYFVIIVDDDYCLPQHNLLEYLRQCDKVGKEILYYVGKHSGKSLGMSHYHFEINAMSTLANYRRMGKRLFLVKLIEETSADTLRAAESLYLFHGFIRKTVPNQEKKGIRFQLCNKLMEVYDFIKICDDTKIQEAYKVAKCEYELFCIEEHCEQDHNLNPLFNPCLHFMNDIEEITARFNVQK